MPLKDRGDPTRSDTTTILEDEEGDEYRDKCIKAGNVIVNQLGETPDAQLVFQMLFGKISTNRRRDSYGRVDERIRNDQGRSTRKSNES